MFFVDAVAAVTGVAVATTTFILNQPKQRVFLEPKVVWAWKLLATVFFSLSISLSLSFPLLSSINWWYQLNKFDIVLINFTHFRAITLEVWQMMARVCMYLCVRLHISRGQYWRFKRVCLCVRDLAPYLLSSWLYFAAYLISFQYSYSLLLLALA